MSYHYNSGDWQWEESLNMPYFLKIWGDYKLKCNFHMDSGS